MPIRSYFVYILKCVDNSYYTGFTNDLERRLAEHESGINPDCYTFQRRPIELVFYEEFDNPDLAIEYEKKIKGWTRKKKEALINGNWDILPSLSECRNSTSHKFYKK
jgi:putative endonuclease